MVPPCKPRAEFWTLCTRNNHYPELHGQFVQATAWKCLFPVSEARRLGFNESRVIVLLVFCSCALWLCQRAPTILVVGGEVCGNVDPH